MTTDRRMRASDQDRENAVEVLRGAFAEGRLRPGEFDQRTGAAYTAVTWGELDGLTADLPLTRADAGLPADSAAAPGRRLPAPPVWVLLIVPTAGLAGLTDSAAVWAVCILAPLALLLSPWCRPHRDVPERQPPRRHRDGWPGTVVHDSADDLARPPLTGDLTIYRDTIFTRSGGRGPDGDSEGGGGHEAVHVPGPDHVARPR